jgi:hypothetical protein
VDGGVEGDRPDSASPLLDAAVAGNGRCDGEIDTGHVPVRQNQDAAVTAVACEQSPCARGWYGSSVHGRHDQIYAVETDRRGVERIGFSRIHEMRFCEIAAVFVDGEQAQSRLADEGDVVAGGGCFGNKGDQDRSGAGDGDGGSAGQGPAWEQIGERRGHGHGPEGLAAYSGDQRFRFVADGRGWFRRSRRSDGGQVGGCMCMVASTRHGGHSAAKDVELGALVESGEVCDRVDGGHEDRPFAVPVGATARIVERVFDCRMCW